MAGEARSIFQPLMLWWIQTEGIQLNLIGTFEYEKTFELNKCMKELASRKAFTLSRNDGSEAWDLFRFLNRSFKTS